MEEGGREGADGLTRSLYLGFPNGQDEIGGHGLGRHWELCSIHDLILQHHYRVGVPDCSLQETWSVYTCASDHK